jgi:hypothetical protein
MSEVPGETKLGQVWTVFSMWGGLMILFLPASSLFTKSRDDEIMASSSATA